MLLGEGLQEIVTNSVTNSAYYPDNKNLVRMINSLSTELDVMRPSMLESGLEVIIYNCNRRNSNLALFEFGKVYSTESNSYKEEEQLALWFTGNITDASWNAKEKLYNLSYVRSVIENLFARNGIGKLMISYEGEAIIWKWKNQPIAPASVTDAAKIKSFDIKQDVFFVVIHWDVFVKASSAHRIQYKEVPKFPSMQRDLAIILDKEVTYQQVQKATEQLNIQSLKDYDLFDVFENEKAIGIKQKIFIAL